jgi:hypothetical protein
VLDNGVLQAAGERGVAPEGSDAGEELIQEDT